MNPSAYPKIPPYIYGAGDRKWNMDPSISLFSPVQFAIQTKVKLLKKYKPRKQGREADICEDGMQEKRQRKVLSGFLAPLPHSDTLIRFLGTGETALTRPEVIKSVEIHKKQSTPVSSATGWERIMRILCLPIYVDLIKARYVNITPNFMLTAPPSYTVEQIDEVRNIWAEFTLNFKP